MFSGSPSVRPGITQVSKQQTPYVRMPIHEVPDIIFGMHGSNDLKFAMVMYTGHLHD